MEKWTDGETPAMLQLETKDFATLLPALAEHHNITLGKSAKSPSPKLHFPCRCAPTLEINGEITIALKEKSSALVDGGQLGVAKLHPATAGAATADKGNLPWPGPHCALASARLSQPMAAVAGLRSVEANFKLDDFTLEPRAPRFLLELKGGLAQLSARLQCAYGSRIMTLGVTDAHESVWMPDPEVLTRYSTRTLVANAQRSRDCKAGDFPRRTVPASCSSMDRMAC